MTDMEKMEVLGFLAILAVREVLNQWLIYKGRVDY